MTTRPASRAPATRRPRAIPLCRPSPNRTRPAADEPAVARARRRRRTPRRRPTGRRRRRRASRCRRPTATTRYPACPTPTRRRGSGVPDAEATTPITVPEAEATTRLSEPPAGETHAAAARRRRTPSGPPPKARSAAASSATTAAATTRRQGQPAAAEEAVGDRHRHRALVGLLGFALVGAVARATSTDAELATARQDDLVRILSDLDASEDAAARGDQRPARSTQRAADSGAQGREAALAEAAQAGRRARHPGRHAARPRARACAIAVQPAGQPVARPRRCSTRSRSCAAPAPRRCRSPASNGGPVRIVASTYFVDAGDGIIGRRLSADRPVHDHGDR